MNNISVCIPTYKRPDMLKKLVLSILDCQLNKSLINNVSIIIVDNDAQKSAEQVADRLAGTIPAPFVIEYSAYPVKGLSNVRNELLRKALLQKPDFLIFVDDDEYVTPDWINELVKTSMANNADLVMGPVVSSIDKKVSKYVARWIGRPDHPDNARLSFIRTGNLLIKVKSLLELNIWFDPRFNTTGGEDSYFGLKMQNKGATIFWAAKAIVYESVPADRASLKWLIKRNYNGANIYMNILRMEKQHRKVLKKIFVSLYYLLAGALASLIILLPFTARYWGILKFSEGMGGITGLLRIKYHEYK